MNDNVKKKILIVTGDDGIYLDQPVTVCKNLVCAQGKKNISPWMKEFVIMLNGEE